MNYWLFKCEPANVVSDPYPDPEANNEKLVVFDIKPNKAIKKPVTLKQIKEDGRFAEFHLVKFGRLSVMPVTKEHWEMMGPSSKFSVT